jgi:ParB family chromosome partitioning protein
MAEKTQKIGLGRGFGSLIPQNFDNSILLDESERVQKLDITKVVANSEQPRQHFDDSALKELSQSIKNHGVLLPLVVTATKDGGYRIVAGERRWRAAKLAKLQTVPAIVRTLKELEELEIALVENVQRVDLSPLEQAISIERLHQQFSIGYDDISKRLGKAYSTVHNIVRLLNLPDDAKAALITHEKAGIKEEKAAHARVSTETPQTKALSKRLATAVNIRRTAKGGKLEIGFKDDDELARIVSLLDQ